MIFDPTAGLFAGIFAAQIALNSNERDNVPAVPQRTPPGDLIEDPLEKRRDICELLDKLSVKYEVHRDDDPNNAFYTDCYSHEEFGYSVYIDIANPYSSEKGMLFQLDEENGICLAFRYYNRDSYFEDGFRKLMNDCEQILKNEVCVASLFVGGEWKCYQVVPRLETESADILELFAPYIAFSKETRRSLKMLGAEVRLDFWDPKFDKAITIGGKDQL